MERRIRPVIATGYGYGMNSVGALTSANGSSTHTEKVPTNAYSIFAPVRAMFRVAMALFESAHKHAFFSFKRDAETILAASAAQTGESE